MMSLPAVAPAPSGEPDEKRSAELLWQWVTDQGGDVSRVSLSLGNSKQGKSREDNASRGLVAVKDILPGDYAVRVPFTSLLTAENAAAVGKRPNANEFAVVLSEAVSAAAVALDVDLCSTSRESEWGALIDSGETAVDSRHPGGDHTHVDETLARRVDPVAPLYVAVAKIRSLVLTGADPALVPWGLYVKMLPGFVDGDAVRSVGSVMSLLQWLGCSEFADSNTDTVPDFEWLERLYVDSAAARHGLSKSSSEDSMRGEHNAARAVLCLLDGSNMFDGLRLFHIRSAHTFGTLRATLPWLTWSEFIWACVMVWSRAFSVYDASDMMPGCKFNEVRPLGHSVSFPVPGRRLTAMVPVGDFCNHSPDVMRDFTTERQDQSHSESSANYSYFSIFVHEKIDCDKPVLSNYAPKANEQLLFSYGFIIDDSRFDSVRVRIGGDWSKLSKSQLRLLTGKANRDHIVNEAMDLEASELLAVIRVLLARDDEIQCVRLQSDFVETSKALGTRANAAARRELQRMLESKASKLDQSSQRIPRGLHSLYLNIQRFKRGQSNTLQSCSSMLSADKSETLVEFDSTYLITVRAVPGDSSLPLDVRLLIAFCDYTCTHSRIVLERLGRMRSWLHQHCPLWQICKTIDTTDGVEPHENFEVLEESLLGPSVIGATASELVSVYLQEYAALRQLRPTLRWLDCVFARLVVELWAIFDETQGAKVACLYIDGNAPFIAAAESAEPRLQLADDIVVGAVSTSTRPFLHIAPRGEPDLLFLFLGEQFGTMDAVVVHVDESDPEAAAIISPFFVTTSFEEFAPTRESQLELIVDEWLPAWTTYLQCLRGSSIAAVAPFVEAEISLLESACFHLRSNDSPFKRQRQQSSI